MIGTTLDKYEVLQKVGEGGMATVYRGRHSTLDRVVAIKILHPHLSSSVRNRARFAREVEAIERLRHDNILEIFDYSGNEGTDCYLVMEFVEGETLTEMIVRRGRLPSEVVCAIGIALCRALGYAHHHGVLHRDVKPDNVMVRVDGVVKLMDFGIARFLDESRVTMTGTLVGSPAFMSPEQAREAQLDQRSDLFSLGTVLFYLATGTLPFTGSNPSLILKNVIEGNRLQVAELAPTMSATLADVIERLMATNPDDRFTQAHDVEEQLAASLLEAHLTVDDPVWGLPAWVRDPEDYEQRLDAHLRRVLVEEGRRLLSIGDHLAALRLLNRVLSMDETHPEALALVAGLHGDAPRLASPRPRALGWIALLAIGAAVAALYAGISRYGTSPTPPPPGPAPDPVVTAPPASLDRGPSATPVAPTPLPEDGPPVAEPAPAVARVKDAPAPRLRSPPRVWEPPPEPSSSPPQGEVGWVHINSKALFANVYLDDAKLGDTRSDVVVPAGTHDLTLRHPLLYDKVVQVTVAAGERRSVDVELIPRPSIITFDASYAGECAVRRGATEVGTLRALGWRLEVERPDRPLSVVLTCPDGSTWQDRWPTIGASSVPFTPE